MSQLIQISKECLSQVVETLSQTPWEEEIRTRVGQMYVEIQNPCLIAVCGEARAGKSTFVNAFLGVDLAKTGVTETTATLSYFKYGPGKKNGTVVCHWRDGRQTSEKIEFVHSLQGHDEEVMKKAEAISHVEIFINSPYLINITLVDTPGSGSLVATHERNAKSLINRHFDETQQLTQKADAVIYLLGHVGKLSDSQFIEEFRELNGRVINPMNAIGVMGKIDRSSNILNNRWHFARDLLVDLPELNTVIPVSALLEVTAKTLEAEGRLIDLQKWLRRIPRETCEELLEEREFFDEDDAFDDCPYPPIERRKKRSGIQWTVFQLIARTLLSSDHDKALAILREYAGFAELRKVLKTHFFERSQLLKCSHVISLIHHELLQIYLFKLHVKKKEQETRRAKIRKFNALMKSLGGTHKMPKGLVELIQNSNRNDFNDHEAQKKILAALKKVESVLDELTACNDDFAALQLLEDHKSVFTKDEVEELTSLFGQYGLTNLARLNHSASLDPKSITQRQRYWQAKQITARRTKRIVVEQAIARYSRILAVVPEAHTSKKQFFSPLVSMASR